MCKRLAINAPLIARLLNQRGSMTLIFSSLTGTTNFSSIQCIATKTSFCASPKKCVHVMAKSDTQSAQISPQRSCTTKQITIWSEVDSTRSLETSLTSTGHPFTKYTKCVTTFTGLSSPTWSSFSSYQIRSTESACSLKKGESMRNSWLMRSSQRCPAIK